MITGEWGDIRIFAVQGKMSKWISGEDFMTYMYGKFVPNAKANSREPFGHFSLDGEYPDITPFPGYHFFKKRLILQNILAIDLHCL